MAKALVVGGGPAGLMAAERIALAGHSVTLCDAMPSVGRKLLMAGKSGLNLTKDEPLPDFLRAYGESAAWLTEAVTQFQPQQVQEWARGLGEEVFTGSSGRVFPKAMKASPLLRAWLKRLENLGVERRVRWRLRGWEGAGWQFDTPEGAHTLQADVVILALGGASWPRLGSNAAWCEILRARGVQITPFAPSNAGLRVAWSAHLARFFGQPLKAVRFTSDGVDSRGEAIVSHAGLEGGGIYTLSAPLRRGCTLHLDLAPDLSEEALQKRLLRGRISGTSTANLLRRAFKTDALKRALLQECARPLPRDPVELARLIKALPLPHHGLHPIEKAISSAGGVKREMLDDSFMLRAHPGVFCTGEMLNWDAPTGGYLLTACLATGLIAGNAAAQRLEISGKS